MIWKKIIYSNIYFETLYKAINVLPNQHYTKGAGLLFLTFINSLVDVIGLAMIIPVIYLINDPSPIHDNNTLNAIYSFSGIYKESMFVFTLILSMVIIFALKNLFSVYVYYKQNKFSYETSLSLIERQASYFLADTYLHSKEKNSNYYVRDIATIPNEFASSILIPLMKITNEFFVLVLIIIGLFTYDIKVLLLLLTTICPVILLIMIFTKNKADEMGNKKNELLPLSYQNIFEIVYSYIDVKLFRRESFFIQRILNSHKKLFDTFLWIYTLQRIPQRVMEFAIILAITILYGVIIVMLDRPPAEVVWILILFATAAYRIMPSLNEIMSSIILVRSAQYIFDILETKDKDLDSEKSKFKIDFKESVELIGISYTYPKGHKFALNNLNLKIIKGSRVGLIGESGSGKTTLGKMILRIIKEDQGQFLVDGKSLSDNGPWFSRVAYVQQDFHIQDYSLAENIAFGQKSSEIDIPKLEKVIQQTKLEDLVSSLEDGYYSTVGEFGGKLSGGQKQRIAIARALYKGAQLLILDEATNSLDAQMENEIMDTIYEISSYDLSILIISHRLNALRKCDIIYEIKEGTIIGEFDFESIGNKI